jgi:hypothetical protein
MAVLAGQRLLSAQLIFDLSTMTMSVPFRIEVLVIVMDSVGLAVFPFVLFAMSCLASLELVSILSVRVFVPL